MDDLKVWKKVRFAFKFRFSFNKHKILLEQFTATYGMPYAVRKTFQ